MADQRQSTKKIVMRIIQWHKGLTWLLVASLAIQLLIIVLQTALPLLLLSIIKVLPGYVSDSLFFQMLAITSVDMAANWLGLISVYLRGTGIERMLQRMRETYLVQSLSTGPFGRKPPASDMTSTLEKAISTDVYWIIRMVISFLVTIGGTLLLSTNPWTLVADIVLAALILQRSIRRGQKIGELAQYSREHRSVMSWQMQKMQSETMRTQIAMNPALQKDWLAAFASANRERFIIDRRMMNWNSIFANLSNTLQDLAYYLEFLIPIGIAYFGHTRVIFTGITLYTLARYSLTKVTAASNIGLYIVDLLSITGEQQEIVQFVVTSEEQADREKAARTSTQATPLPTNHAVALENFSIAILHKKRETKQAPTWEEWKRKTKKTKNVVPEPEPQVTKHLLNNVSLNIGTLGSNHGPGEICGVVGENGSGKTTLLKALMSRLDINSTESNIWVHGRVSIGTVSITAIDEDRYVNSCVAYCQQRFERSLGSVRENIIAGNNIAPGALDHVVALLHIKDLERNFEVIEEDTFSGGEKRKIAIAQVAVRKVLIAAFDEPSNDLDGLAMDGLVQLLQEMREAGMLVLVISHEEKITKLFDSAVYLPGDGTAQYDSIENLARIPKFAKLAKV